MRLRLLSACFAGAVALSYAQVPADHDLKLVGDRFTPLTWDALTPEQKIMVEHLFAGERHGAGGPFNVLLRAPELGDELQAYGAYIRYHPSLSRQITEFVIMTAVRYWNTESEWNAHKTLALRAGLDPAIAAAIAEGVRPQHMPPDVEAAYNVVDELLTTHELTDKAFKTAVDRFGEKGVVDMAGAMGYYGIVSFALNVDRYPLPKNVKPELNPVEDRLPKANPLGFATPPEPPSSPIVFKTSTVANGKKMILRGDRSQLRLINERQIWHSELLRALLWGGLACPHGPFKGTQFLRVGANICQKMMPFLAAAFMNAASCKYIRKSVWPKVDRPPKQRSPTFFHGCYA